jgi:hypothetical protein
MHSASALGSAWRSRLASLGISLGMVLMIMAPGAAQASTYRFWNFWTAEDGVWAYSQLGPASTVPPDGSVQGWVFAATDAASASVAPNLDPKEAFDAACANTPAQTDKKRVAIVIDPGAIEIAPVGQTPPALSSVCAVASVGAQGYELLNSVTELRTDNGFICAINSYPAMECSAEFEPQPISTSEEVVQDQVLTDSFEALPPQPEQSNALAPISSALVIGLLAVAGFYYWRRRTR